MMKIPDEFMAPDRGHVVGHHLQPQPQPQNSYRRGSLEDSKPSFKVLRALKFTLSYRIKVAPPLFILQKKSVCHALI